MPFTINNQPHFIAYSTSTGAVHFSRIHDDGEGFDILWTSTWGKGWSQLMPFSLNNQPHFIAYNTSTGAVHFDRIHADGEGFDILWTSTWGKGWSQLMPFSLNNQPHFIAYNTSTGAVHFDRIHADGEGFDILWTSTWGKGWSQLMPFSLNNQPHFIASSAYDVSPSGNVILMEVGQPDPCDISKMTLRYLVQKKNIEKIHRFLRLWRALDWPMGNVDRAIHTFGDKLDIPTLQRIEALHWLQEELKQPIENMLTFWGNLDTWGSDSLYDRLFLPKGLVPTDPTAISPSIFALAADRTELSNTSLPLEDHLPTVFAALQLTMADYEAIVARKFPDPKAPPKMTLKNLSLLHRYGALARALRLRVKDIVTLIRFMPDTHDPFRNNDPEATRNFVRFARAIQASTFSVPLLNYLFRHEVEPTRHPAPTRILIVNTLKSITDDLTQVNQDTQPVEDPLGEELRKQLGMLASLLVAPKTGEESNYIKPEEIQQTIDFIDWRRSEFQQSDGKTFLQKLHDTLLKDLGSSFLGPDLTKDKITLFGNLQPNETKDARFATNIVYLRDKFLPWLRERLQHSLVSQTLAAALGLEEVVTKTLVERILHSTSTPPTPGQRALNDFLNLAMLNDFLKLVEENGGPEKSDVLNEKVPPVRTFVRVFKAAQIAKAFDMTETELTYLSDNGSMFGDFDLNKMPLVLAPPETLPKQLFASWIAIERFFSLRKGLPKSERTLEDFLNEIQVVPSLPNGKTLDTLVEVTGWERKQIEDLENAGFKRDTVKDLQTLQRAVGLMNRVGASAAQLSAWAKTVPEHVEAQEVIETVKVRYDQQRWLEVARGLNDPLREKQRAALVDFLTPRMKRKNVETANSLLEHFLIDIEMSSCMLTSRIKQANSSVQMFVQRCLLNLEQPEVSPDEIK
ncbi:MAG TPA: hypothetical protein PKH39_19780, partial [Woeseiaceae bacterium]|nr:hypothetical protein [Woeseiaceae bacterium]